MNKQKRGNGKPNKNEFDIFHVVCKVVFIFSYFQFLKIRAKQQRLKLYLQPLFFHAENILFFRITAKEFLLLVGEASETKLLKKKTSCDLVAARFLIDLAVRFMIKKFQVKIKKLKSFTFT
jgi:inorganic pyrophosphatase/exopolyphosphatase